MYHDSLAIVSYNFSFTDTEFFNLRYNVYQHPPEPQFVVDGVKAPNDTTTYKSNIDAARSVIPSFNLTLDARGRDSLDGSINLKIVNVDSLLALDSVYALVAVCQDSVEGPGSFKHGYNYVCRNLFYFPISVPYADSTDTTITFMHTYPIAKLHAVAFIQNLKKSGLQYLKVYQAVTVQFQVP